MNNTLTVENLIKCIEEGHDYGDEPICKRCNHYGPGDQEHESRLRIAYLQASININNTIFETQLKKKDETIKICKYFIIFMYFGILYNLISYF